MSHINFTVKYDGESLSQHEMDVSLLAPALMGMSELVKQISLLQSRGEYTATLSVRGNIQSGSIEVDLVTQAVSLVQQVKSLFAGEAATALANFGGILGMVATIYHLIQKYQGRTPDQVELKDKEVVLQFNQHLEIVNPVVYQIYNNYEMRNNIYQTVKPLHEQGIEEFAIIKNSKRMVTIAENEVLYFIPENIHIPLNESIQESILIIEGISFKEKNKWAFSDGSNSFKALILDEDFLQQVDGGERFAKGDWLKVLLRKIQAEENGKLKTTYEIIEVIEHIIKEQYKMDV